MVSYNMQNLCTTLLLALPLANALTYSTSELTADFNDLTTPSHIGLYHTLHFSNLHTTLPPFNSTSPLTGGLYPQKPNSDDLLPSASTMACHDTLTAPIFGPASITSHYPFTNIALFDLQNFSFGCRELDPETHVPGVPVYCAVTVRGYAPGAGFDYEKGGQNFFGVRPSQEMTLWYTIPGENAEGVEDGKGVVTEESKVRMVRMEHLDRSWWALGAVTFEAVADVPVMFCVDDVRFKTYNVTGWEQGGIARLYHQNM